MRKTSIALIIMFLVMAVFISGCPKKTPPPPPPVAPPPQPVIEEPVVEPEPAPRIELRTVFFDYDKYNIRTDQAARLADNAEQLMRFPDVKVRLEGHCDERGTEAYNIALGERRARSVKNYLTEYGIPATRITTRSYGEERPVCRESTEDCWQRNRRVEFIVVE
ncbi:MAG TPA: peptidoglycan-associated lipoprotein Pal [candidate division Zixibacteria bacterium]|nr:peptidoglycan-associated lipoprotein Pal [candidate division Zixibacteria bacterium]